MTPRRVLIRHGRLVSMDDAVGNPADTDVLIVDGVITEIGADLDATGAEVIEAAGRIVAPGFIDTHRHTWQTQLRALCADWTLGDYIASVRFTVSPAYGADDLYLGNYAGALEAVEAGVTTLLDFSHCNNSPAHSDAALRGLRESGIRGVFAYGFFDSSPFAPQHFTSHDERLADFHRIADELQDADGLVRIGVALNEPGMVPIEATAAEVEAARSRGALLVTHTGCAWTLPSGVTQLEARGLIDANQVHVHCNALTDEEWATLAAHDAKISISPECELSLGMGKLVFAQARRHGIRPTLSADVVSLNTGDMFHQLRLALSFARWALTEEINLAGRDPVEVAVTVHEALSWVTTNAAEAMGLGEVVGSITVGKRADLMIVGGGGRSQHPHVDPEATLVFQTSAADVETVLIDGRIVKRDGRLVGVDTAALDARLEESRREVFARIEASLPATPPGGMFPTILDLTVGNLAGTPAPATR